jgi:hypothetical protein
MTTTFKQFLAEEMEFYSDYNLPTSKVGLRKIADDIAAAMSVRPGAVKIKQWLPKANTFRMRIELNLPKSMFDDVELYENLLKGVIKRELQKREFNSIGTVETFVKREELAGKITKMSIVAGVTSRFVLKMDRG